MRTLLGLVSVLVMLAVAPCVQAQIQPLDQFEVEVRIDSKAVENRSDRREVIWATVAQVPDVAWLRLHLGAETVLGAAPADGKDKDKAAKRPRLEQRHGPLSLERLQTDNQVMRALDILRSHAILARP